MTRRSITRIVGSLVLSLLVAFPSAAVSAEDGDGGGSGPVTICTDAPTARPTCYIPQADGSWVVEAQGLDGGWLPVTTVAHPLTADELARGFSG